MSFVHNSLTNWFALNPSEPKYFSYGSFMEQMHFFRNVIPCLFSESEYGKATEFMEKAQVVGEHRSKSIDLPVVQFQLQPSVLMIVRCNFMNWKVSIISDEPIECDFIGLFDPNEKEKSVYCEGFEDKNVYPPYALNKKNFTLNLNSTFEFYTFLYVLRHYFAQK